MRPPVIVIGAHRSGTSATIQALHAMGLFAGADCNAEHLEPRWFAGIHNRLLWETGGFWFRPGPTLAYIATPPGRTMALRFLRDRFGGRVGRRAGLLRRFAGWRHAPALAAGRLRWGWKEPRTTLFSSLYAELFPEARFLHVVRHPLDVAMSLHRRELEARAAGEPPCEGLDELAACVELAELYVAAGLRMADDQECYCEIRFEDLQDRPEERLAELARFCDLSPGRTALQKAAGSIDRRRRSRWEQLAPGRAAELMARASLAGRFGYGL